MDSIISSVVTPVVESLLAPVKKHLGFFVSSTKYVTDMKEKMAQLSLTEQDIRHKWEEAVARNHDVSHHVLPWLEEVKKMNQKAQSIPTAIAKYTDQEDLKEETEDARADRLHRKFEGISQQGQKVLVIIDDLWKVFDLKDVGLSPLPNGFKLLFTSRDRRICTKMGVRNESIFDVGFLNYKEAKTLFFRAVGISDADDPSLQRIGEDIVKRCGGLPIAIVTIAKSLADNIHDA
ncbi:hypothetical protein E3N88_02058 [Mikania micrantha]|uniref:NB-ARC domain-containing protein n=1 Tax=Mikania micrantha TaxID=192012 RepID=A0A5N6Q2Z6_9ASTR|nr:hypothetical protein E3N88_02058 [Mikania micrantha]